MSMTKTNTYISVVVANEIRSRFVKKRLTLKIEQTFIDEDFVEEAKFIILRNVSIIVNLLNDFGYLIQNLKLETSEDANCYSVNTIFWLIQEKCSNSLLQLNLNRLEHSFLRNISKPFKNLENLTLIGTFMGLSNRQFAVNEIFPALRHLELDFITSYGSKAIQIALNYPFLEHLDLNINPELDHHSDSYLSEAVAVDLLKKNPQIKRLSIDNGTPKILKVAADELNIEELQLYHFNERNQIYDFYFENVKIFKIGIFYYTFPANIKFSDKLEEFEVNVPTEKNQKYLEIIEQSKGLRRLRIKGKEGVNYNAIIRLIAANLNVTDLNFVHNEGIECDKIIEFIKSCKYLNVLNLKFYKIYRTYSTKTDKNQVAWVLQEHFGNDWTVGIIEDGLIMERKIKNALPIDF